MTGGPTTILFGKENKYKLGRELGHGAHGKVREAVCVETSVWLACKTIELEIEGPRSRDKVEQEFSMLQHFKDTQLVTQSYELVLDDVEGHIVTQLCRGGSLGRRIRSNGPLTSELAAKYLRTLAEFAVACHGRGLLHNDLKPDNILLEDDTFASGIRVSDFGLAGPEVGADNDEEDEEDQEEPYGTPGYMAPEVEQSGNPSRASDMYGVGGILYFMLTAETHFRCGIGGVQRRCLETSKQWHSLDPVAQEILKSLLHLNPNRRYSAEQLLSHPWLGDADSPLSAQTPGMRRNGTAFQAAAATLSGSMSASASSDDSSGASREADSPSEETSELSSGYTNGSEIAAVGGTAADWETASDQHTRGLKAGAHLAEDDGITSGQAHSSPGATLHAAPLRPAHAASQHFRLPRRNAVKGRLDHSAPVHEDALEAELLLELAGGGVQPLPDPTHVQDTAAMQHHTGTLQTHRPVNLDIQDFTVADMLPQITANNSDDLTEAATSVLRGMAESPIGNMPSDQPQPHAPVGEPQLPPHAVKKREKGEVTDVADEAAPSAKRLHHTTAAGDTGMLPLEIPVMAIFANVGNRAGERSRQVPSRSRRFWRGRAARTGTPDTARSGNLPSDQSHAQDADAQAADAVRKRKRPACHEEQDYRGDKERSHARAADADAAPSAKRLHQTTAADPPELAKALDVPEAMRAVFNNTRSRTSRRDQATARVSRRQK